MDAVQVQPDLHLDGAGGGWLPPPLQQPNISRGLLQGLRLFHLVLIFL